MNIKKYTALVEHWSTIFSDGVIHQWTAGKEYSIGIDEINNIASIESDGGVSQDIPLDTILPELLEETFGITVSTPVLTINTQNTEKEDLAHV